MITKALAVLTFVVAAYYLGGAFGLIDVGWLVKDCACFIVGVEMVSDGIKILLRPRLPSTRPTSAVDRVRP